jgi:hypothetical protein
MRKHSLDRGAQAIPDDIKPADRTRLAALILGQETLT